MMRRARVKRTAPANASRNVARNGERVEAEGESTANAGSDPLVAAPVARLAALLKAGNLTPKDRERAYSGVWPRVPKGLLPFIESPRLERLAEALKAHPRVYWHPLVARQMFHLLRLASECGRDGSSGVTVALHLKALIKAHADGLHLGEVIGWKPCPKKSGPRAGIKNPHPAMPWDDWICPAALCADFHALHGVIESKLRESKWKPRGGTPAEQRASKSRWFLDLALTALKESDIDWSGIRYRTAENAGRARTADKETELFFCDEDFAEPEPWGSVEVKLGAPMLKTLEAGPGRLKSEGEAAHLAYVVLAALLSVEPTKVRDSMEHRKKKVRKERKQRERTA